MELRARDLEVVLRTMADAGEATDESTFAAIVLRGVDDLVGSEIATYNVVWLRERRSDVVMTPPGVLSDAALARFNAHVHQHPLIRHYHGRPTDARALSISDFLSLPELYATDLHREFFAPLGIDDQLAINLPLGDGSVIGIAVNRGEPSFSARERAVLELFRGHVARALGGLRARRRSAALIDAFERGVDAAGAGLALVGRGGEVEHRSAEATRLLGERLPEPVVTALAAGLEPPALVEHAGHRLRLELVRGEIDVLVVRELPAPAADHGLTLRELAVLEYVRDGLSDAETAAALGISPRTVHHHLHNAYAKLGVANRTAAVARVFRDVHGER